MPISPARSRPRWGEGFTLVELLVVIAVIALLIGLLVPAVHAVRESARRTQCKGNVRGLASGCRQYESIKLALPSPGLTGYVGDPDLDTEGRQMGGWLYNILPYIEQMNVHSMGAGLPLTAAAGLPTKPGEISKRIGVSVPLYACPSRGSALFTGLSSPLKSGFHPYGQGLGSTDYNISPFPSQAARSDYAGAWGEPRGNSGGGALEGDNPTNASKSFGREMVALQDGYSNVFLCGERYLAPEQYRPTSAGIVVCNDRGWSVGREADVYSTVALVVSSVSTPVPPMRDTPGLNRCTSTQQADAGSFGGPHDGVVMAMCDGAVRVVDFGVDPAVFMQLGRGNDGGGVDLLD